MWWTWRWQWAAWGRVGNGGRYITVWGYLTPWGAARAWHKEAAARG